MPQLVTVKPKPGSRKFTISGNMTQFNKVDGNIGTTEVKSTGEFKGQRFPNSRQFIKVKWSFSKRRWLLAGATRNSEKLNEIVRACKLKYEDDHTKVGQYIEEADIFDREDPFFTHSKMKMMAREGEFVLDKDYPKDKILIMGIQAQHEYEVNGMSRGKSSRVKYVITDKNLDKRADKTKRNRELEAIELYKNLDDKSKIRLAIALGFISNEKADMDTVDSMLYAAAKDTSVRKGYSVSMQEYFIGLCNASVDEINVRYLIQKARGQGYLKKVKDSGWMMFGQPIGNSDKQVYDYFKNPSNSEMIVRLEETLEVDKKQTPNITGRKVEDILLDDSPDKVLFEEKKTRRKKKKENDE